MVPSAYLLASAVILNWHLTTRLVITSKNEPAWLTWDVERKKKETKNLAVATEEVELRESVDFHWNRTLLLIHLLQVHLMPSSSLTLARQKTGFQWESFLRLRELKRLAVTHEMIFLLPHAFWLYVAVYRFMLPSVSMEFQAHWDDILFLLTNNEAKHLIFFFLSLYRCPYEFRLLRQVVSWDSRQKKHKNNTESNRISMQDWYPLNRRKMIINHLISDSVARKLYTC